MYITIFLFFILIVIITIIIRISQDFCVVQYQDFKIVC